MTINYTKVKILNQDAPCTIDQIRHLRENLDVLKIHRGTVMAAYWPASGNHDMSDDWYCPSCWTPAGTQTWLIWLHVYNTGASTDKVITLQAGDELLEIDVTFANGVTYQTLLVSCPRSVQGSWAQITYRGISGSTALFMRSFCIFGVGFSSFFGAQGTPAWGEVADSRPLRQLAEELYDLNVSNPQHLATSLQPYEAVLDAAADTYKGYWLVDYMDDQLSEESKYYIHVRPGKTADTSYGCAIDFDARESSDTVTLGYNSGSGIGEDAEISATISGESYSTGAGSESAILISPYRVAGIGTADNPEINGCNVWLATATPSTNRKQGAYRSFCDIDYFDLLRNEFIDVNTVNGLAGAIHNSYQNRAGQVSSLMIPGGRTYTITTTGTTVCTFGLYLPNRWEVGEATAGDVECIATWIIKNNSASARTVTATFTELDASSTDSGMSDSIAAGATEYHAKAIKLSPGTTSGVLAVECKISADASASFDIYCLTLAKLAVRSY